MYNNFNEMLMNSISEGFAEIAIAALPIIIWILIPAIVFSFIFGKKEGWGFGALLGLCAYGLVGPYSTLNLF